MLKISIIIPTYNRPRELNNCLQSILDQKVKLNEVIIVDDGDLKELPLKKECENLGIQYIYLKKNHKKEKKGQSQSRNKGVNVASGDIYFFFDDDVVLLPGYMEEILNIYRNDPEEAIDGVGGLVANRAPKTIARRMRRFFDIIFLLSGFQEGRVLASGFCAEFDSSMSPPKEAWEVDFLSGGVSSYRSKVFREFSFDDGYAFGEDKDFSFRVSRKHKLKLNPRAKLLHLQSPKMRPNIEWEGSMEILGRYIFFRQHIKKGWWSGLFFYYSLFGYTLVLVISLVLKPNKKKFFQLKGVLSASKKVLRDDFFERKCDGIVRRLNEKGSIIYLYQ